MPVCPKCNTAYGDDLKFCSRDGAPLVPLTSEAYLPLGALVNESLRVVERIRTDRLGVVYRVEDAIVPSRSLALRLFRRGLVSSRVFAALGELSDVLRSTLHETDFLLNYIPIQLEDGRYTLLSDDVHGETLDAVIAREAPLTPTFVVSALIRIAEDLGSAHRVGLFHGNVTPENVLVVDRSETSFAIRLADFGLASTIRRLHARSMNTGELAALDNYDRYYPPELVTSRGADADARTDVFAIGALCYQMLSGWIPFSESALEGDSAVYLTEDPRPLIVLNPELGVPPALERIMLRALEHDPSDRQQSMEAILGELQEIELDLSINPPPSARTRAPKRARRSGRPASDRRGARPQRDAATDEIGSGRTTGPVDDSPLGDLDDDGPPFAPDPLAPSRRNR
jgi:serine/threonine protein kinase